MGPRGDCAPEPLQKFNLPISHHGESRKVIEDTSIISGCRIFSLFNNFNNVNIPNLQGVKVKTGTPVSHLISRPHV